MSISIGKRLLAVAACVFAASALWAQITLDEAIAQGADKLEQNLDRGAKVAVLNFRAPAKRMADYVMEELTAVLVDDGYFTVVDRQGLDLLQEELNFQFSGEVSEESVQALGRKLGAELIISGSVEALGASYRFRLRAVKVTSASIEAAFSASVVADAVTQALTGADLTRAAAPPPAAPAPAAPATPAAPPASTPVTPSYTLPAQQPVDFTAGERFATWALNWLVPGLGSYVIMRDWTGGTIYLGSQILGMTLMVAGLMDTTTPVSHDLVYDDGYGDGDYYDDYCAEPTPNTDLILAGVAIYLGGGVFNIVRSVTYHKPLPRVDITARRGRMGLTCAWSF